MSDNLFKPVNDHFIIKVLLHKLVKLNAKKSNISYIIIDILNICMFLFFILVNAWQYVILYIIIFTAVCICSLNIERSSNLKYFARDYTNVHFDEDNIYIDDASYKLSNIAQLCCYKDNMGIIINKKIYFLFCENIDKKDFDSIVYTARCMMYPFAFESTKSEECGGDKVE